MVSFDDLQMNEHKLLCFIPPGLISFYRATTTSMGTGVIMTVLMILWTIVLFHSVQAAPCTGNQHCSRCHPKTGHCLDRCDDGYFDRRCSTICSAGCKNNLCGIETKTGAEKCSEGCKQGYRGLKCNSQCSPPGRTCTQCQNGCNQGYCNIGLFCFSGCHDSYYGSDCKNCSRRCKSCNRITGTCEECQQPYVGPACEQSSKNCLRPYINGCTAGCKPGFYGPLCGEECSDNCLPGHAISAKECLSADTQRSSNCTPHCHRNTGECISGCRKGWYGPQCTFHCNLHCRHSTTNSTDSSMEGCVSAHLDEECTPWSESLQCHSRNGSCLNGCISGYYGEKCNHTCETCLGGMCDQDNGSCVNGCQTNFCVERCEYNCTQNFSAENCTTTEAGPGNNDEERSTQGTLIIIVLSTAIVLILIGIVVVICIYCRKRRLRTNCEGHQRSHALAVRHNRQNALMKHSDTVTNSRASDHIYCEIKEEDMGPVIVFL